MGFKNENVAQGFRNGPGQKYQAGVSDVDKDVWPPPAFNLPWVLDPATSWLDHNCWIEIFLDSGIVVHRVLPQVVQGTDTLGVAAFDDTDFATKCGPQDRNKSGVNLVSQAKFTDIQQRMANSQYRFCLKGWARRAGYQVPIPSLKTVGGVPAIPDDQNPQRAFNRIIGNLSGIPLWFARWELWYTVLVPPKSAQATPDSLADHIGAKTPLNVGIQPPLTVPDDRAVPSAPPANPPVAL